MQTVGWAERAKGTRTIIRKIYIALALSGLTLSAAACNTVKGLANDIESVGEAGDETV